MKDVCVGPLVPPWFLWSEKKELTHQIVLDIPTNSSSKTDLLCTWISIQNIKFRLFSLTIIDLTYESKPNFSQLWNEDQNLLGYTVCYGTHCNFYEFAKRFFWLSWLGTSYLQSVFMTLSSCIHQWIIHKCISLSFTFYDLLGLPPTQMVRINLLEYEVRIRWEIMLILQQFGKLLVQAKQLLETLRVIE